MPLTPPGIAGVLIPALAAAGNTGISIPQFALGVGIGITTMAQSSVVTSVDTGTLGVGTTLIPLVVPPPLLVAGMLSGFASTGNVGIMAPAFAAALAAGLAAGFLQGLLTVTHPSVGVGSGVAKILVPSAVPAMIAGLAAGGMIGIAAPKLATGIGIGLTIAFSGLVLPIPIVGSPSTFPGAGAGVGKIV